MADEPAKHSPATSVQSMSSLSSSTVDETEMKINVGDTCDELTSDFYKFLDFDVTKEEAKFNDSVELMLTKLDEFFSLVDMIRSDTSLCLGTTLPDIQAKCKEMEVVFEKIDKLEEFVSIVRESVSVTEENVNKAESELGTMGGLVKKLTSFISISKKPSPASAVQRQKQPEYVPPEIFSAADYFHQSEEDSQAQSESTPAAAASTSSSDSPSGADNDT